MESYMDVLKDRADQEECYAWAVCEIERLREDNKQYLECLTIMATVALDALKLKEGE